MRRGLLGTRGKLDGLGRRHERARRRRHAPRIAAGLRKARGCGGQARETVTASALARRRRRAARRPARPAAARPSLQRGGVIRRSFPTLAIDAALSESPPANEIRSGPRRAAARRRSVRRDTTIIAGGAATPQTAVAASAAAPNSRR
jgi:hypothetical protein